ncbi:MAG: bifunctional riboflavin kinase/FAD synthetase [Clostridia bacterium]|nr:bifunctional riboflavin kinase/FAD synthetase [Clostridia bacterium]
MQIINITHGDLPCTDASPSVVALGNFDGVHIGHVCLIRKAVETANKMGVECAVFTFARHPETVLVSRNAPSIMTLDDKLAVFEELGVDRVYLGDFETLRGLSPDEFVNGVLKSQANAVWAVCGFNFRFGKGGLGTPADLVRLMDGKSSVIEPVTLGEQTVSSSLIRSFIEGGKPERALEMLGRPFYINFPVIHGKHLGRCIGVPTINQDFPKGHIIPECGVYACKVYVGGKDYIGVANVGSHPTVDNEAPVNCETHIIGYSGWLYGEHIKVSFYKKVRDEKKFSSVDELVIQITQDIADVKEYFNTEKEK